MLLTLYLPCNWNQYLEHFPCCVSLWCPYEVVRVLQEVLEGGEGLVLRSHGQEGGVGRGEVLKQEHASKYHQGEDYPTRGINRSVFLSLKMTKNNEQWFCSAESKPVEIKIRREQRCSKSISRSSAPQARNTSGRGSWHGGRRGQSGETQTERTRQSMWSHERKKRTLRDLFREI